MNTTGEWSRWCLAEGAPDGKKGMCKGPGVGVSLLGGERCRSGAGLKETTW